MQYFIALDFDDEASEKVHDYASSLNSHADKVRTVKKNHIHLTLSFLGDLAEDKVEKAKAIVNKIDQSYFTLKFDSISYFKPSRRGLIIWVGPTDNDALKTLQAYLNEALNEAGFTLDDRPYIPHVTLARNVRISSESFDDFKENFEPFNVPVTTMSLMLSSLENGQLIHTPLVTKHFNMVDS